MTDTQRIEDLEQRVTILALAIEQLQEVTMELMAAVKQAAR